jgi:penicillin-binding protein 2
VVEAAYKIPLKKENLQVVKRALAEVTVSGTAAGAFVGAPYTTAGKTGTAQVYSLRGAKYQSSAIDERLRDHSLFMAFAPLNQPKIAIAVIVENAGWGGSVAAPIVRKVFDAWLLRDPKAKPQPGSTPPIRQSEALVPGALRVAAVTETTP